jgi:hypothetical protein
VTATDANGYTAARVYHVSCVEAPEFTSSPDAVVESGLDSTVDIRTADGYPTPSLVETGTLPAGLSFTDNGNGTGTIGGTTTATGSYQVTISATSAGAPPVPEVLSLWVASTPLLSPASVSFTPGKKHTFTITTTVPATLLRLSDLPKWVDVAPGSTAYTLTVSGKAPESSAGDSYPAGVTVTGLAPPATPPSFTVDVS